MVIEAIDVANGPSVANIPEKCPFVIFQICFMVSG